MSDEQKKLSESQLNGESAPLSPHRAFVVQFRGAVESELGHFAGRVEHVVSGQAVRFQSLAEFLAFLKRMTTDEPEQPP